MSTLSVEVTPVLNVVPHPNADRLDIAQIKGWNCVVGRGSFKPGDLCVYFPIDSVLPEQLEERLFEGAKVKLNNGRIRTIKLRGAVSQGLAIPATSFPELGTVTPGEDVAEPLGVTKWEPPVRALPARMQNRPAPKRAVNSNFKKYTDLENIRNYHTVFQPGEQVVMHEKIHGTNFRAGYVETEANNWWRKTLKFFGLLPRYQFVYGSRNVQLQDKLLYTGYYKENVYADTVQEYFLKDKLGPGEVVYGEIYGPSVQKGYHYGESDSSTAFVVFDVQQDGRFLNDFELGAWCHRVGLTRVPELYRGPFDPELVLKHKTGPSVLAPSQPIREGLVVRPVVEDNSPLVGRKILKAINEDYLLRGGEETEFQ